MLTLDDLKKAIRKTDFNRIKDILKEKPKFLKITDDLGSTLLNWLASDQNNEEINDRKEIITFLLKNYTIDIDQPMQDGFTALHEAVTCQLTDIVEILLDHGAKIIPNTNGWTPLHSAAIHNYTKIVKLLLDNGADAHAKNIKGDTAAHLAASENEDLSTLNCLIKNVPDIRTLLCIKNNAQETPFDIAMARTEFSNNEKEGLKKVLFENSSLEIPKTMLSDALLFKLPLPVSDSKQKSSPKKIRSTF